MIVSWTIALSTDGLPPVNTGYSPGSRTAVGTATNQGSQTLASGVEALNVGDATAGGELYVKHLGTAGRVELSYASDGSSPFAWVDPSAAPTIFRPKQFPVYAKAMQAVEIAVAAVSA